VVSQPAVFRLIGVEGPNLNPRCQDFPDVDLEIRRVYLRHAGLRLSGVCDPVDSPVRDAGPSFFEGGTL
jgi:hypothetical protein